MSTSTLLSILLRIALLIGGGIGVWHAVFGKKGEFMNAGGLLYYTIQSNLWVMLCTAIYLVLSLLGVQQFPHALQVIRFVIMVGITITFLVFWTLLAPQMEKAYLLSLNNFLVHTFVPLFFIADFFLFNKANTLQYGEVCWCVVMPLYYFVFTMIHAKVNPSLTFDNGSHYPYFFLDVDTLGWFGFRKGLGVFWWVLINFALALVLGFFFRFLQTIL